MVEGIMSNGEEGKGQYIVIPRREFLFFSLCTIVLFVSFIISDCVQSRADRAMRTDLAERARISREELAAQDRILHEELADKKRTLRRERLELEKEQWRKQQGKKSNP